MIARLWRGFTSPAGATAYEAIFRTSVRSHLESVDGFCGAHLLRNASATEVEFFALTFFASIDSVRSFTGPDVERAVVSAQAREVLTHFEARATNYTVVDGPTFERAVR